MTDNEEKELKNSPGPSRPSSGHFSHQDHLNEILYKLYIIHEIALDKSFVFEKNDDVANDSFVGKVAENLQKAYWDLFEAQLNEDPPNYSQAVGILSDIREGLLSALPPYSRSLRTKITELLDMDLIKQELDAGAFDVKSCSNSIINLMAQMCAPVRDDHIKELRNLDGVVPILKGIFELLQLMQMDMINYELTSLKPEVVRNLLDREKHYLQDYFRLRQTDFQATKKWIAKYSADLTENDFKDIKNVMCKGFVDLLKYPEGFEFPETLFLDGYRFQKMREEYFKLNFASALTLVTSSAVAPELVLTPEFRTTLASKLYLLINGYANNLLFHRILPNLIEQICADVVAFQKTVSSEPIKEQAFKESIKQIVEPGTGNYKVLEVVQKRIDEFLLASMKSPTVTIPSSLSCLTKELTTFSNLFRTIVSHNILVFYDLYQTQLLSKD